MSVDDLTLELNHPMTEEEMDHLLDVDLEHTSEVEFKTKHGKRVIFVRKQSSLMTKGGWISVKDRMPEQAGYRCLVSAEYGDGKRTVFTAFTGYGEPGWWTYESVYMEKVRESDNRVHHNYHITHWMPLPEPPTGDKS